MRLLPSPGPGAPPAPCSVETRWDVAPAKGGSRVTVHIQVPFSKKTMWQRFIEKGSFDDTLEMVQGWRQMVRRR